MRVNGGRTVDAPIPEAFVSTRHDVERSRASRSALFARRRVHRRSSIRAGPPILARPPLSVQAPFLLGSRVDTAAPILARAPPRLQPPFVIDHGCNSG